MNVLIVGSGGREHAYAWKLRQSPRVNDIFVAPGNDGMADVAATLPLTIPKPSASASEAAAFHKAAIEQARDHNVQFVVVAADDPLALGLVDALEAAGLGAFGPNKAAAQIEASKAFAKELLRANRIPMSESASFDTFDAARAYIESRTGDVVVKADGLASGKGSIVTSSHAEAVDTVRALMLDASLGPAGRTVVVEDRLYGRETSAHAFTDGKTVAHMPFSCDHKPVYDGDRGPNTGGMGIYSPAWWLDDTTASTIRRGITEKAVHGMAAQGTPFRGVIYPGIFVTDDGPRVIEFNARFGDPEAEALLPLLETDLMEIMLACANQTLDGVGVRWRDAASVTVMLASAGYPGPYQTGKPISGLDDLDEGIVVFHAGTRRAPDGTCVTNGGRVLGVTATASTLAEARDAAYRNVRRIHFDGMHYRTDIGAAEAAVRV